MSIRMKEWGMMRAPADAVHIPVQGLTGWDSVARDLGKDVSSAVLNTVELVQGQERVQQAGELARFSRRLQEINQEARDELADRNAEDWDYAWRVACESRLKEALAELPPTTRQAGEDLAHSYFQTASLQAYRDRKVEGLQAARANWQGRVDSAVESGDEEQAQQWLELGKDIFVAPARQEEVSRRTGSLARLSRWKHDLADRPLDALERHRHATDAELPQGAEERKILATLVEGCVRSGRKTMADEILERMLQKDEVTEAEWGRARRAGLISERQYGNATAPRKPMEDVERCRWFRKVDEAADDEEARLDLQLDISTSTLPAQDRLELLQRLQRNTGTLRTDRTALSNTLWNLYNRGAFGCPGDSISCRRLAALQRTGSQLLSTQGAEAAAAWLQGQERDTDCWICYADFQQNTSSHHA